MVITGNHNANHNFNPRTPRGVRLLIQDRLLTNIGISIHAPREGCDSKLY